MTPCAAHILVFWLASLVLFARMASKPDNTQERKEFGTWAAKGIPERALIDVLAILKCAAHKKPVLICGHWPTSRRFPDHKRLPRIQIVDQKI